MSVADLERSGCGGGYPEEEPLDPSWGIRFREIPKILISSTGPPTPVRKRLRGVERNNDIVQRREDFRENFASTIYAESIRSYSLSYDSGVVDIFHGFRERNLASFQSEGICLPQTPNEFSRGATFYASDNIAAPSYEHPLRVHPAWTRQDCVAVFGFKVDIKVLYGVDTFDGRDRFSVFQFQGPDENWKTFCERNLARQSRNHRYDIIIGPACIPKADTTAVRALMDEPKRVMQFAFCTEQWRWLEKKVEAILELE